MLEPILNHSGGNIKSDAEIYKSFDGREWAHEFVEHIKNNPSIATDEDTMTTWFCSALMRGYDEHYWRSEEYKKSIRRVMVPFWKRFFVSLDNFGH